MSKTSTFVPNLFSGIIILLILVGLLILFLYNWFSSNNIWYLIVSIFPLIGIVAFGRPVLFCQHVKIDGKLIIIHYWTGKGHTANVSKSLYQIVLKDDEILSYRFQIDNRRFQITPRSYINGAELSTVFQMQMKQNKTDIDTIIK
ncbi:MAG: hypothetical protein HOD92_17300 [Deltaproteobacteria bacterium]|jgi:hypothetical protein|nr:hypothetical protein [Deltaproteobacteria bacterium]MBT4526804.1 hypothetical protein [Deltaproteobacteria bacterium]MBT4722258.1 hypothetical protein [Candidatus Falkowbacteria bacterium]